MNRVIPVIIIIALLLLGGVWLSRQNNANAIQAKLSSLHKPKKTPTETNRRGKESPEDSSESNPEDTEATETGLPRLKPDRNN